MFDSADTIDDGALCGTCAGALGLGSFVHPEGRFFAAFCSERCSDEGLRSRRATRWAGRARATRGLAVGTIFVGGFLAPHQGPLRAVSPPRAQTQSTLAVAADSDLAPLPAGWFGPEWPPSELGLLAALGRDAWVHPLAGPVRRMPRTDARVFGAVRPGNRAVECRNGHCGVDLGGEIYGEHVRATHDGVVDRVQRAANPDHGGRFVRLSHHEGTVFTQYFHLAAIPRGLERGMFVKGGQVIGLLGDSGVKESAPHLHFTVSIRLRKDGFEKYIDPEPLIALWPVHVPVDGSEIGLVTTVTQPGVPLGSLPLLPGHKRKAAAKRKGSSGPAVVDDGERPSSGEAESAGEDVPPENVTPESTPED